MRRDLVHYTVFALLGVLGASFCYVSALKWIGVIQTTTILYTYPLLTVIGARLAFGEKIRVLHLALIILGVGFTVLLMGGQSWSLSETKVAGALWALSAAACVALFGLFGAAALLGRVGVWLCDRVAACARNGHL